MAATKAAIAVKDHQTLRRTSRTFDIVLCPTPGGPVMPAKPSGTVTFLLTDIEGSTELLERLGDAQYARLLTDHMRLLRAACKHEGGWKVSTQGDSLLAGFKRARDAAAAAVAAQQAILAHPWPDQAAPRVRMGIHTGEPGSVAGEYIGLDLHRAARICAAGHGGQILLSGAAGALIEESLPPGTMLRYLGSHRLKDLRQPERIFQLIHRDLPAEFPRLRSLDAFPNNLPRQLTSFIGRSTEIAEVKRLLPTTAILMLTGTGGCGKTRLALEVAADLIDVYADGVWLVDLSSLTEPDLVLHAAASAVGVRGAPGRPVRPALIDFLRPRELLLVFDNCEHLLAACVELALDIVRSCPRIRLLGTSREPFGVPGEVVWRVPSLSLPESDEEPSVDRLMQCGATRLFIERATAVQPEFAPTARETQAVAAVCRRLDGMPLAIELAAARMAALSAEQIASRLNERFRLLSGGSRRALPRQQTLRGALDWSHDLLGPAERALLRRLSVFAGGCMLEPAEAVCAGDGVDRAAIVDLLTQLVFKSLVLMDASGTQVRYRLLETVRQYGRDRLDEAGETAAVRARHLRWYLSFVERAEPELSGAAQSVWLDRLEEEHDNLRAALEWGRTDTADDTGLRLAHGLWQFWNVRGHFNEGRAWLESMLANHPQAFPSVRAKALAATGIMAYRQGDYDAAIALCTESLALFRDLPDPYPAGMAQMLYVLGMVAESQGDFDRARAFLTDSLELGRQTGDKRRMAIALNSIGEVARCQDDYAVARASYDESLALSQELGAKRGIGIALGNLGHVALYQEDFAGAAMLFKEALRLAQPLGYKLGIAEYLAGLGGVAASTRRPKEAACLLGAAEHLLSVLGGPLDPPDQAEYHRSVAAARDGLDERTFTAAWAEGKAMALEQAVQYALNLEVLTGVPFA